MDKFKVGFDKTMIYENWKIKTLMIKEKNKISFPGWIRDLQKGEKEENPLP